MWCTRSITVAIDRYYCRPALCRLCVHRRRAGGEIATARPRPGETNGYRLAAEAEATDDLPVALDVVVAYVIEKAPASADQLQEATTGVMVALVHLQMLGEVDDALAQYGDLHFG